jgi:hypothetical protein
MSIMSRRQALTAAVVAIALTTAGFKAGEHFQGQPHMAAAKQSLIDAQKHLTAAEADKGGHREKAMKLVKDAIAEVQAGIDYAAQNH